MIVQIQFVPINQTVPPAISALLWSPRTYLGSKSFVHLTSLFNSLFKPALVYGSQQGLHSLPSAPLSNTPLRIAEVLYPVPDQYLASTSTNQPNSSLESGNVKGKPKRRASLLADRITTSELGKSNWNVSGPLSLTLCLSLPLDLFPASLFKSYKAPSLSTPPMSGTSPSPDIFSRHEASFKS
jgi:hypothetical protein